MKIAYVSVFLVLLVALPNISSGFQLEKLSKKNNLQTSYHTYSTGRRIDVFTQRGGKGQDLPSDSFGPQEEVLLYANVTYNDFPIGYKYVGFEVKDPDGTTFAILVSTTNDSGIANNSFTLPYPPDNSEEFFGTWKIIATVDIAGVVVNDTMCFEYGYLPDIAVSNVWNTKTVVCQGYTSDINAIVMNEGYKIEAFNVTVYANLTIIESQSLMLANLTSRMQSFSLSTSGFAKGNYIIKVYAVPIQSEVHTSDNSLCSWIIVSMVGDITGSNGWPDGRCDMSDLYVICKRLGKFFPDADYVPNYDINNDLRIDMGDIYIVHKNFGKIDP